MMYAHERDAYNDISKDVIDCVRLLLQQQTLQPTDYKEAVQSLEKAMFLQKKQYEEKLQTLQGSLVEEAEAFIEEKRVNTNRFDYEDALELITKWKQGLEDK